MGLVSGKSIFFLGAGGAGIAALQYVPLAHKKTVLIGSIVSLGAGAAFLLNDAAKNTDAFIAEGGLLGFLGKLFSGKEPPAVTPQVKDTPLAPTIPTDDGGSAAQHVLKAKFTNTGKQDSASDYFLASVEFTYKGPPASLSFDFTIMEHSLYGDFVTAHKAPQIHFTGDGAPANHTFKLPTKAWVNSKCYVHLKYQGEQYAFGVYDLV